MLGGDSMLDSEIGYSVTYYPIVFTDKNLENKLSNINKLLDLNQVFGVYSSTISGIQTSKSGYEDYYSRNVMNFLNQHQINFDKTDGYIKEYDPDNHHDFEDHITNLLSKDEDDNIDTTDIYIEILEDEEQNTQIRLSSLFVNGFREFCQGITVSKSIDDITYDYNRFETTQVTFILNPIRIKTDGSYQTVYLTLDIINFKFAMIKCYQNIQNEEELLLFEEEIKLQIEMITPVHNNQNKRKFRKKKDTTNNYVFKNTPYQSITEIVIEEYIYKIFSSLKTKYLIDSSLQAHYLLKDFEIKEEFNSQEKEKIYRIVNAPINNEVKLEQDLIEELYNASFNIASNKIWASTRGMVLSYVNEVVRDSEPFNPQSRFFSFESVVDFPLKTIILERLNNIYLYTAFFNKKNSYEDSQKEYIQNEIRLLNIVDDFYGSALNLIQYFKNQMKWYVNKDSFKIRNDNLQLLIENDSIKREKKNARMVEIVTVLLTIVFGFSAIKDILKALTVTFPDKINLNDVYLNTWSLFITLILIVFQVLYFMNLTPSKLFNLLSKVLKKLQFKIEKLNKKEFK